MKLIKCLNAQCLTEYIGIVDNAVKPPCFYTVEYILKYKAHLLKRKVFAISAINTEVDGKQVPAVMYYLGI